MRNTVSMRYNSDFKRLYYKGTSFASACLALYTSRYAGGRGPSSANLNCLGITVSKKLGGAVVRNRVRRLIRECYRLAEPNLRTGYRLVIVARGRAAGASFAQIDRDLHYLLKKSGLLSRPTAPEEGKAK